MNLHWFDKNPYCYMVFMVSAYFLSCVVIYKILEVMVEIEKIKREQDCNPNKEHCGSMFQKKTQFS